MNRVETPRSRTEYILFHLVILSLLPVPWHGAQTWALALREWQVMGREDSCNPWSPAAHLHPHGTEMKQ